MSGQSQSLLQVRDLAVEFTTDRGRVRAVDGLSFDLVEGGTLGIVGESGCGKSVTSLAVMGLLPSPPGRVARGEILFDGKELRSLSEAEMRGLRGNDIAMIFQEPMSALNPVYTVGFQIAEGLRLHQKLTKKQARGRSIELLTKVGIPSPELRIDAYPHELSGGMRQRVMIAIAISCSPKLLIADEPTTALDVTIQAQVLSLLSDLQRDLGMGIVMITHDLGVVAEFVDHVLVMYAGKPVEYATTQELFETPLHPYTRGLLASIPGAKSTNAPIENSEQREAGREGVGSQRKPRLRTIDGMVPDLANLPTGCRFRSRCDVALARCAEAEPEIATRVDGRQVACFAADSSLVQDPVQDSAAGERK